MMLFNDNPDSQSKMKRRHTIGLKGVLNSRELGGYRMKDGRTIKRGKLLRTAQLKNATSADIKKLSKKYHLDTIIDLRVPAERLKAPDPKIDGVKHTSLSPLGIGIPTFDLGSSSHIKALADAMETGIVNTYQTNMYHMLVTEDSAIKAYRQMFVELMNANGKTVLWHCVDGKDRTGIAAALILSALGADRDTIMADYLVSNKFNAKLVRDKYKKVLDATHSRRIARDISMDPSVRREWMEHALNTIDKEYGSMYSFLVNQLGMTPDKQKKLRDLYLK